MPALRTPEHATMSSNCSTREQPSPSITGFFVTKNAVKARIQNYNRQGLTHHMRHTVLPAIKMAAAEAVAKKRGKVSSAMPVGSEVSFTTVLGTKLRGNVVATDESAECLVISILT